MSDNKLNVTLTVAQSLLEHLAEPMRSELKHLLDGTENGMPNIRAVIKLLSKYENIRTWMDEQTSIQSGTKHSKLRGDYEGMAGTPNLVSASQKWVCPRNTCDSWMLVIQENEPPPICKRHEIEIKMVREGKKKG